jgi:predicted secreted protein
MAVKSGRNGSLRLTIGAVGTETADLSAPSLTSTPTDSLGNLRSWSIEQSANILTVDTASMGNYNTWNEAYTLSRSWSASFAGLWDEGAPGVDDIAVGRTVRFALFPDNSTAGTGNTQYYSGTAVINSLTYNASYDGMVELSFSVTGKGALSYEGSALT